jgi:AcrR family transcriptional regulator
VSAPNSLDDHPSGGRLTLSEEALGRARERILHGAMAVMATIGLDATIDQVARQAGVSRRTVFRHFASQGDLFAAAINEVWRVIDARMPAPPSPGTDVEAWLRASSIAIHRLLRDVVGRAFWDIHIERPGTSPEVTVALAITLSERRRHASGLASGAWVALGAPGEPPPWVLDAFILQLSGFATNAMVEYDTEKAGHVSARILSSVLSSAIEEQRRGGAGQPGR